MSGSKPYWTQRGLFLSRPVCITLHMDMIWIKNKIIIEKHFSDTFRMGQHQSWRNWIETLVIALYVPFISKGGRGQCRTAYGLCCLYAPAPYIEINRGILFGMSMPTIKKVLQQDICLHSWTCGKWRRGLRTCGTFSARTFLWSCKMGYAAYTTSNASLIVLGWWCTLHYILELKQKIILSSFIQKHSQLFKMPFKI